MGKGEWCLHRAGQRVRGEGRTLDVENTLLLEKIPLRKY